VGRLRKLNFLLLYLVISLTIIPYIAYADIYSATLSGSNNVPGAIKSNDAVSVRTQSILPVTIDFSKNGSFISMTCNNNTPIGCNFTRQVSNQTGIFSVTIMESGSLETVQLSAVVDMNPPQIDSVAFTSSGNGVRAAYTIADTSLVADNCSGVKSVELFLNGKVVATQNYTSGICLLQSSITGAITNYLGFANTSLVVTDFMGYKVNVSGPQVTFDSRAPKFIGNVLSYRRGTNERVTTLPANATVTLDLKLSVRDDSLSAVYADLSGYGTTSNSTAICVESGENGTSLCTFSGVNIRIQNITQRARFYAVDTLGNVANITSSVGISIGNPRVAMTSFVQKAGYDENLTKIGGPNATKTVAGDVVFNVRYDSSLDLENVVADLSPIAVGGVNGVFNSNASGLNGSLLISSNVCERISNNTYTCIVRGVNLKAKGQNTRINVYAVDEAGVATLTQVSPAPLSVVLSAGTVTSLAPEAGKCVSGTCYIGALDQKVSAVISSSSSFNQSTIQINGVKAACSQNGASLVCNATVPGGSALALAGEDDFGNALRGESKAKIAFDPNGPQIISAVSVNPECPTSSESLTIRFNASDAGASPSLVVSTDASEISTQNKTVANCAKDSAGNYACALTISAIKSEGKNVDLNVILSDVAGNSIEETVPVSVCGSTDAAPNLISSVNPIGTLPKIDRKVANKIPMKAVVGLEIKSNASNFRIVERSRVTCSTPGVTEAYTINDNTLTPTLFVSLRYNAAWNGSDVLALNCTQEYRVRSDNLIYKQMEVENIYFNIGLYNQPLGTIDDAYERKVDEIKERLRDLDTGIRRAEKVNKYLGTVCKYAENIGKLNRTIQTIKSGIWAVMFAFQWIPGMDAAWAGVHGSLSGFHNQVETFIWPSGWVPTGGNTLGLTIKYTCTIYYCKTYDYSTYVSIGMSVAQTRLAKPETVQIEQQKAPDGTYIRTMADGSVQILDANGNVLSRGAPGSFLQASYTTPDGKQRSFVRDEKGSWVEGTTHTIDFGNGVTVQGRLVTINENQQEFIGYDGSKGYFTIMGNDEHTYTQQLYYAADGKPFYYDESRGWISGSSNPTQQSLPQKTPQYSQNAGAKTQSASRLGLFSRFRQPVQQPTSSQITIPKTLSERIALIRTSSGGLTTNNEERMTQALDAFVGEEEAWIYNPYKSEHFDQMCFPATIFNSKKERELLCKKLGCINQMARTGGPIEACEYDYNLGHCLYVDSARYKIEGGMTVGGFLKGFFKQLSNNIVGTGTMATYLFVFPNCVRYQLPGWGVTSDLSLISGPGAVRANACGVGGALMSLREFTALANNKFNVNSNNGAPTSLPADADTFCQGVNYAS
jgi:hypothetical protein